MQEKGVLKTTEICLEKKLLSTVDELERNIKTASEKGLERIAKMQNLSQNEIKSQKCKTNREMN